MADRRAFSQPGNRCGFSMAGVMQGMVLLGVMAAIAGPPIARQLPRHRVARAADVVADDIELAFALAARQRKPMRVTLSGTTYTIADRVGGTVRHRRQLGPESEYRLQGVTFSANPVDVFPSGVASSADTVTLTSGSAVRRVVLAAAGKVGILR